MEECSQKDQIKKIQEVTAKIGNNGSRLEDAMVRMATAHERQASEIREMTQTITAHMLDNREFRITLTRAKEEHDLLFTKTREAELADIQLTALMHNHDLRIQKIATTLEPLPAIIKELSDFKGKLAGGLYIVPSICTIIVVVIQVISFMRG